MALTDKLALSQIVAHWLFLNDQGRAKHDPEDLWRDRIYLSDKEKRQCREIAAAILAAGYRRAKS